MMKKCSKCKEYKDLDHFNKNKTKKDGLSTFCKICTNIVNKQYYEKNGEKHRKVTNKRKTELRNLNRQLLYEYYQKNPCIDCGESDPIVLESDHKDGVDKKGDISKMVNDYSWNVIMDELKKCDTRCANCHRRRTAEQQGWYKYIL